MDLLELAIVIGGIGLFFALVAAIYVVWENSSSQNLILATGALAGAMMLFVIQTVGELKASSTTHRITTELTIDRAAPRIRQWEYGLTRTVLGRLEAEVGASDWLAKNDPTAFTLDGEKLTSDMVMFSLISFLLANEYDWQLDKVAYRGKVTGEIIRVASISSTDECSSFDTSYLKSLLLRTENVFADAPLGIGPDSVCLPPKSTIEMIPSSFVIRNPICQLSFNIEPSPMIYHRQPGTGEVPTLPTGRAQFETRPVGLRAEVTYFALRAHHRDRNKYREWCSRVIRDAREWFES